MEARQARITSVSSHSFREFIRLYLELTKSGIVALVSISVTCGYLLGQSLEAWLSPWRFLGTLFGVFFLASGSSALNQIQEVEIDAKMPRTQGRPIPSGRVSVKTAWAWTLTSLFLGLILLSLISFKVFVLGVAAVVSYNFLYTLWWKQSWAFAAVPGAIPGALPVLMGFVASSDQLSSGGWYVFSLLFYWQMPHFWSLAIKYRDDYSKGGIPVLPVREGVETTRQQIVIWTFGYVALAHLAPLFLDVGIFYSLSSVLCSLKLLAELRHYSVSSDPRAWLRFFLWVNFSLILYYFLMVIDRWSIYLLIPLKT